MFFNICAMFEIIQFWATVIQFRFEHWNSVQWGHLYNNLPSIFFLSYIDKTIGFGIGIGQLLTD